MTLRHKTYSAIRWTTAAAAMRALLQLAQVAILARLLRPEDYGLVAMVGVVLGFAALFADLGVSSAYVQRQGVTPMQRSSLFWLNVLVSACLTVLVIAAAPLFAWFFRDARLVPLMVASASTLVLNALGQQVRMSAEKELDFRPVVLLEICAALVGFASAVAAALAGWGACALVLSGIVSAAVGTALAWMFVARGWRPAWRLRWADVGPMLGFGGAVVAGGIINQINRTVDVFLGGRWLTATQLGLYSVPRNLTLQLQSIVNPVITRVGFPLIAQVQADVVRVRSIYLKTMNMTASTNAPLYLGIAFFAPEIITVFLGAGWDRSAGLLRILALWGGLRSTGNPVGSLTQGTGRPDLELKWNLVLLAVLPPVLWLGSQNGPEGMAWALLGLQVALFVPAWFVLVRPLCGARLAEYAVSALKPFVIAAMAVAPAYAAAMHADGALIRLIVGVAISAPLYLAMSYKGNPDWFNAMLELVGRKARPA
jgi:O-antigen/teichoic acid export membrane protein